MNTQLTDLTLGDLLGAVVGTGLVLMGVLIVFFVFFVFYVVVCGVRLLQKR